MKTETQTNNLFIQSFMDNNSNTFLEIGSKITEKFTSVPTDFKVTFNGTCWIDITKDNFIKLQWDWNITEQEIQEALDKQFFGKIIQFNII